RGTARRIVRPIPTTIAFGSLDLPEPRRIHLPELDEPDCLFAIDLRPDALPGPRREALQPVTLVTALLLAIDPPEAQGGIYGLQVRNRSHDRALPGNSEPHARGRGVVLT